MLLLDGASIYFLEKKFYLQLIISFFCQILNSWVDRVLASFPNISISITRCHLVHLNKNSFSSARFWTSIVLHNILTQYPFKILIIWQKKFIVIFYWNYIIYYKFRSKSKIFDWKFFNDRKLTLYLSLALIFSFHFELAYLNPSHRNIYFKRRLKIFCYFGN